MKRHCEEEIFLARRRHHRSLRCRRRHCRQRRQRRRLAEKFRHVQTSLIAGIVFTEAAKSLKARFQDRAGELENVEQNRIFPFLDPLTRNQHLELRKKPSIPLMSASEQQHNGIFH